MQNVTTARVTVPTTTGNYTVGQQIGGVLEVPFTVAEASTGALVHTISLLDISQKNAGLRVFLFKEPPIITSSDKQTLAISGAELFEKCLGVVVVANADYISCGAHSVATKTALNLAVNQVDPLKKRRSLWAILTAAGTVDFEGANRLNLVLGVEQFS